MRASASAFGGGCQAGTHSAMLHRNRRVSIANLGQRICPNRFDRRCAPGFPRGRAPQARRKRRARCVRPVKRGTQRLRDSAELQAVRRSAILADRGFRRRRRSSRRRPSASAVVRAAAGSPCCDRPSSAAAFSSSGKRPLGEQERRAVGKLDQRLGALLQARHGGEQLRLAPRRRAGRRSPCRSPDRAGCAMKMSSSSSSSIWRMWMPFSASSFCEVEARRALVDVLDLEPADHVVERSSPRRRHGSSRAARDSCAAPPADSPWRGRPRRRARRGASTASRRPRHGSAGYAPSPARPSPSRRR